jgi:hypothetical protein
MMNLRELEFRLTLANQLLAVSDGPSVPYKRTPRRLLLLRRHHVFHQAYMDTILLQQREHCKSLLKMLKTRGSPIALRGRSLASTIIPHPATALSRFSTYPENSATKCTVTSTP